MWKVFLLFISSCSIIPGPKGPISAKGSYYQVHFQSDEWSQKEDSRSDYIWLNNIDGRILLSNSFCEEFQDRPLDVLAVKTFSHINELKIEKKSYMTFKDRHAYHLEASGLVDGVPVGLKLLNTRRNNCYYDFVSITPLRSAKDTGSDFNHFINSVEFK